ncbi:DUF6191 domain-containing protein [Streptomyces sp. NPDC020965]|uniref:DUF6191 domain-containing protein n=1 Tax=Streptomyces sp. NPDC020965 TaxID=3365105 RepID=UPI00379736A8
MFNAFEEIFAPGRKHTEDERNRVALTRTDIGDSDPCQGPIDLTSGKVTVRRAEDPGTSPTDPRDTLRTDPAPDPPRDAPRDGRLVASRTDQHPALRTDPRADPRKGRQGDHVPRGVAGGRAADR